MWNEDKPELVEKLVTADYRHTNSSGDRWTGTERIRTLLRTLHEAIAELHYTEDAMNVEADLGHTHDRHRYPRQASIGVPANEQAHHLLGMVLATRRKRKDRQWMNLNQR